MPPSGPRPPGARRRPAVRDLRRPRGLASTSSTRCSSFRPVQARLAATGSQGRGDARLLRLLEGRRTRVGDPRALHRPGAHLGLGRRERHRAHAVPRPRGSTRTRRRTGQRGRAGPAARIGRRPLQAHRAGRGDLRAVRRPVHRRAPHRADGRADAPGVGPVERGGATAAARRSSARSPTRLDETSRERFFELVKADGFAPWFAQVTPMEEIGLLALGSRPARRGLSVESLEDLRAIPWVFAWTQARINLTGWFGLGIGARGGRRHRRCCATPTRAGRCSPR